MAREIDAAMSRKIVDLYRSDERPTIEQIVEITGTPEYLVSGVLKSAGVEVRSGRRQKQIDDQVVVDMYVGNDGPRMSMRQIVEHLGIRIERVRKILDRNNIDILSAKDMRAVVAGRTVFDVTIRARVYANEEADIVEGARLNKVEVVEVLDLEAIYE